MSHAYPFPFRLANDCVHLGPVTDFLDCHCPHRWTRSCALHKKTNIDNCMTCKDYQPEKGLPGEAPPDGSGQQST